MEEALQVCKGCLTANPKHFEDSRDSYCVRCTEDDEEMVRKLAAEEAGVTNEEEYE